MSHSMNFEIRDWLGIPFLPHGRGSYGCDCWGLVYLFYAGVFNLDLPKFERSVDNVSDPHAVGRVMTAATEAPIWRDVAIPQFGDILTFGTRACFYHVGVFIKPGLMLHTRLGTDSTTERYDSPLWHRRFQGFFRYRKGASAALQR